MAAAAVLPMRFGSRPQDVAVAMHAPLAAVAVADSRRRGRAPGEVRRVS